ncbi:zinc-binding alcohol dehydrogenase family protein [Janthinobacterium sp. NKUCC08_JDC]|uniref:zinc-binding alcohol dehydrogenase family protein n=1 Tax=Janthinobacterium sp. NKUCC08_JDC TaxID=2842122 RepID=UPI001C5B2C27|nr:zinc-binding alcohol dehydrogenase family protein [Janthinobacterium sp. NKUCC08_JDC]MBW3500553.1 zinc-binding alcohol dehydrogenase family protein [Janthinobacterium sp. NKUCC08_JDC]
MKSIVCDTPGSLRMEQRPVPVPGEGEVLLRIRRVGICGTDMHIFRGTQPFLSYPRVMGHELSGHIDSVPAGSRLAVGDQVYVMPYLSCGTCVACRQGKTNCCTRIEVLGVHRDGGMTEYLALPERFVFKTEGISLDDAAMIEFLAIGAHAVKRGAVDAGKRVLVVGAGPIGMAVMLFASLKGADVTVLDGRADRLQFCRDALGVTRTVQLGDGDKEQLSDATGGEFFDVVFDATGNIAAMERGLDFVAHGGSYVLVSIVRDRLSFSDPEFHKRETTLLGSRNATVDDFEEVVAAMKAGKVPTALLNTHRTTLDEFTGVLDRWMQPEAGVIKAIVEV